MLSCRLMLTCALVVLAQCLPGYSQQPDSVQAVSAVMTSTLSSAHDSSLNNAFDWTPSWRSSNDCGVLALYILMRIDRRDVTLDQIRKLVPVDKVLGSSLEAIVKASHELGYPLQARYIEPAQLKNVKGAFIYHGRVGEEDRSGHFSVILSYDPQRRKFLVINQESEIVITRDEKDILSVATGYILIPEPSLTGRLAVPVFFASSCLCAFVFLTFRSRPEASQLEPQAV